jgi:hypothetical protein
MTTRKPSTAIKIRRALNRGLSPSEVAQRTGASIGYVYAIKSKMTPPPAPVPAPAPEPIKLEVPLIPFAPIPQGIAGLTNEPPQPVAAHAASEIVEEAVIEKPDNIKYVWVIAGILLLTAIFLWYFGHRG